jgi:hypothetical protein
VNPRAVTPPPTTAQQLVTEAVQLLMRLRGDKQRDLAVALGVVRPAVTARLNYRSPWAIDDLDALAAYFDVPPATFLVPVQLLLGGGGMDGDQGSLAQHLQPVDPAKLVQQLPGPDARKRRQRGGAYGPRGGELPGGRSDVPKRRNGDQLTLGQVS